MVSDPAGRRSQSRSHRELVLCSGHGRLETHPAIAQGQMKVLVKVTPRLPKPFNRRLYEHRTPASSVSMHAIMSQTQEHTLRLDFPAMCAQLVHCSRLWQWHRSVSLKPPPGLTVLSLLVGTALSNYLAADGSRFNRLFGTHASHIRFRAIGSYSDTITILPRGTAKTAKTNEEQRQFLIYSSGGFRCNPLPLVVLYSSSCGLFPAPRLPVQG